MINFKIFLISSLLLMLSACSAIAPNVEPEDLALLHREAQAAFDQGDDTKSLALYEKLTKLANQDAETWFRLGNLYAKTGNPQSAQLAYQQSLSINPAEARAWNNLGVVLLRQSWQAFNSVQKTSKPDDAAYRNSTEFIDILIRMPSVVTEKSK
jgi:tetratricopeptide (TPR) repeat protein